MIAKVGYLRVVTTKGGRHRRESGVFVVRAGVGPGSLLVCPWSTW